MKYILRGQGQKAKAHIWYEEIGDTACTMWSTGGLKTHLKWLLLDHPNGRQVCANCEANYKTSLLNPSNAKIEEIACG